VFRVANDATKPEIKAAVEALFDVKVTDGQHPRTRRARPRSWKGKPYTAFGLQEGDRDAG
jgi:large subunit ribosomal protein L23